MDFGEKIRLLRNKTKMSQEELAESLSVQRNTVWRWENKKANPSKDMLSKLAAALNTTVSYLTGETDVPDRGASAAGEQHIQIIGRAVELDVYSLAACMGYGKDNENEPREKTGTAWLDERVVGPLYPVMPYLINVDGNSMEPKIYEGDRLVVNENVMPGQGDICLARYEVNGYIRDAIKYYYPTHDGGFILRSSETSGIPPLQFTHEQHVNREAFVVGRIMYIDRGESV